MTEQRGRVAYTPVIVDEGFSLGIAEEGRGGYYPSDFGTVKTWTEAEVWARQLNERLGLTSEQALLIVTSSMAAQNAGVM